MKIRRILSAFVALLLVFSVLSGSGFASAASESFQLEEATRQSVEMAADSMVLLKNDNNCLPMAKETKLNLFGYNATDAGYIISGGGSATSAWTGYTGETVSIAKALRAAGVEINEELLDKYAAWDSLDLDSNEGFNYDPEKNDGTGGPECTLTNPTADFYTEELMQQAKSFSDVAVVVIGRYGRENGVVRDSSGKRHREIPLVQRKGNGLPTDYDRTYLQLSTEEELMLEQVCSNFENVIVLLNTCNTMEVGFLSDPRIDAAMYIGPTGHYGARAIPQLLFGDVNPSGRISDVYTINHRADPTFANAYAVENPDGYEYVTYQEGIYYGYRWYETAFADGVKLTANGYELDFSSEEGYRNIVQYPFGYGLSYTTFSWEITRKSTGIIEADGEYSIQVKVTNTGSVAGKDVVQLYVTPPYTPGGIEKAAVTLVDFAKTDLLQPGESQELTLSFTGYDLASYDCYDANGNGFAGYELETGEYKLKLMKNAHEPAETNTIVMEVQKSIQIQNDPVTGAAVVNRFTGEDSFGSPLDGGVAYMTRADFAGTFPTTRTEGVSTKTQEITYDGELKTLTYGQDKGMYLFTKSDGTKATIRELSGQAAAKLVRNEELFKQLSDYDNEEVWDQFLSQITKEETLDIIRNGGFQMQPTESLGIPYSMECDGPSGLARDPNMKFGWPSATLYACSWNTEVAYGMGSTVALQAKKANISHWYAPGLNLHRSPYTSRNYEYYSEDPILAGKMATAVVQGAKQGGLAVYVKHFAASEAGKNPLNVNTWLTEQAFREIYLKAFEFTVKEADANGMMTAFNRVGDVLCSWNSAMIQGVLREEWGFQGCVITDWWNQSITTNKSVLAGNDKILASQVGECTQPINLNEENGMEANAARMAVKNIIYPMISAYATEMNNWENEEQQHPEVEENEPEAPKTQGLSVDMLLTIAVVAVAAIMVTLVVIYVVRARKLKKEDSDGK